MFFGKKEVEYETSFQKVVHDNAILIICFLVFAVLLGGYWARNLAQKTKKKSKYAKYADENNDDPKDEDYNPSNEYTDESATDGLLFYMLVTQNTIEELSTVYKC